MTAFRILLAVFLISIIGYTAVTISNHGWNLLPVFFSDMAEMAWPGQFNFDFMCFLLLSALWVAWRNHFSLPGLGLALLAATGGMMFLSLYLLIISFQVNGDIKALLLGPKRAAA
jgi:hypothetical protein